MNGTLRIIALAAIAAFLPAPAAAQSRPQQDASKAAGRRANAGREGTPGRIAKFTATGKVGDANITEDDGGRIGVGTTSPTSPLTVNGIVETAGAEGGVKFPDGTVQTSAALSSVVGNATLQGDGTSASPLGVALPLRLIAPYPGPVVEIVNSSPSTALSVTSSRGIGNDAGGTGLLSQAGGGDVVGGIGIAAGGGSAFNGVGGDGVRGFGGNVSRGIGGYGVSGFGGAGVGTSDGAFGATGGFGVRAVGGSSSGAGRRGGTGIEAVAGSGLSGAGPGRAGIFRGDVDVIGTLSKAGGSFKIDHPVDPENKTLSHSFVESPDMKNLYDGVVSLDANGEAVVEMPEWFDALNRDFRYLLTPMGASMPGLYVAEELENNRFKIAGGAAGMKVSWLVTGTRQDAWANKNRIPVEEQKPEIERGYYLHPEAFDQPEERGVSWAHEPERMRKEKELRLEARSAESPE